MAEVKWEAILHRTQTETARAVLQLIDVLRPAVPQLRVDNLESAESSVLEPLAFSRAQAQVIAELAQ